MTRKQIGELGEGLKKGHLLCDVCGHEEIFDLSERVGAEGLAEEFESRDWFVFDNKDHCPKCSDVKLGRPVRADQELLEVDAELYQDHLRDLPPGDPEKELGL